MGDGKALAYSYRTLQHWNQWLTQTYLGESLIEAETKDLSRLLDNHFGKHALLVGVPNQYDLLKATTIACHSLLSPLIQGATDTSYIEGNFHELAILTGSIDLVLLPHTLELVDNPRQLLAEACRIIKPQGLIVICGFNPYSVFGLRKRFSAQKTVPWSNHFIEAYQVKKWLHLADFELEKQETLYFRPPINNQHWHQKLTFLESIFSKCFSSLGGVYVLLARAQVTPLTPIRMQWKQQLSGMRISTTISSHIAEQSK